MTSKRLYPCSKNIKSYKTSGGYFNCKKNQYGSASSNKEYPKDPDEEEDSMLIDRQNVESGVDSIESEDETESDISLTRAEGHEKQQAMESWYSREVTKRQLSYPSIPLSELDADLLTVPGDLNNYRRSLSTSPSISVESVALEEFETISDDMISLEEVEDETESTITRDEDEFVNLSVKVEKRPYVASSMKVTVSVQPASETEDFLEESDGEIEQVVSESSAKDVNSDSESGTNNLSEEIEESEEQISDQNKKVSEENIFKEEDENRKTEIKKEEDHRDVLDLLESAIQDSEIAKQKLLDKAAAEAEEATILEMQRVASAKSNPISNTSPLVKIKEFGGSVVSGVQRAVSSTSSKSEKIVGESSFKEQQQLSPIVANVKNTTEKVIDNSSNVINEIIVEKKSFEQKVETIVQDIDKKIQNSVAPVISNTSNQVSQSIFPPTTSIVVANVIVHEMPRTRSPEKIQEIDGKQNTDKDLPKQVSISEIATDNDDSPSKEESSKENDAQPKEEKDDYLSVYADSMDSSEDEGDKIFEKPKSKEQTEEERKAVEAAKNKLIEEWKSARRESIDDIDERFPHILEDMVSEMHMKPFTPVLPQELKEAVKVSEEEETLDDVPSEASKQAEEESIQGESIIGEKEPSEISIKSQTSSSATRSSKNTGSDNMPSSEKDSSIDSQYSSAGSTRSQSVTESSVDSLDEYSESENSDSTESGTVISSSEASSDASEGESETDVISTENESFAPETVQNLTEEAQEFLNTGLDGVETEEEETDEKVNVENNEVNEEESANKSETKTTSTSTKVTTTIIPHDPDIIENQNNKKTSSSKSVQSLSIAQRESSLEEDNDLPNFYDDYTTRDNDKITTTSADLLESDREDSPSQKRKWKNSAEIASTLSHYLHIIQTETVENCVTEIIPLLTKLLVIGRKNKAYTAHGLATLIATLSAIRVLCERLHHVKIQSGEKALRNMDLSYLLRILCKISADPESKLQSESSFTLAKLVKAAGPELITRPIYFLLVMENEGFGHKRGSQGSKTKAAALDTLTYALLTFPKEDFDDLEEIARWVCLVSFHPLRRVRQAALECISVLGSQIGSPDAAVSRFRGFIVREAELQYHRSDSDDSTGVQKGGGIKTFDGKGVFDVSPITAISSRLRKRILPLPSPHGLVEYGVKVPTGEQLVRILTKMQEREEEEFELSTSEESDKKSDGDKTSDDDGSDSESIRMSDLEKAAKEDKTQGKHKGKGKETSEVIDEVDLITPDVAYVLAGKGKVNTQEVPNNDEPPNETEEEEKKKHHKKKKKKRREIERTYSEYEDSLGEDD